MWLPWVALWCTAAQALQVVGRLDAVLLIRNWNRGVHGLKLAIDMHAAQYAAAALLLQHDSPNCKLSKNSCGGSGPAYSC